VDSRFYPAVATMLAGVGTWILLVVWQVAFARMREWPAWVEPGLCLAAGGLIAISGFS
jgi:hypothetical protein